jgi:hypothetical protein
VSANAKGSTDKDSAGRKYDERVDKLFAELQERTTGIIKQCEQINASAIEHNLLN